MRVIACLHIATFEHHPNRVRREMPGYDYRVDSVRVDRANDLHDILLSYDANDWDVVSVVPIPEYVWRFWIVLRRLR